MIRRPRIKSKFHVEDVPGDGIFLLSENERHVLEGNSITELIPLLNGQRTWNDLLQLLDGRIGRDEALVAFDVLTRNNHIEEGDGALPPQYQIFWSELGLGGAEARQLVTSTNVHIIALGNVNSIAFEQSIRSFGFMRDDKNPPSIIIAVTDDYQRPELASVNMYCLERGLPWMLVKPGGLIPLVGPLLLPGRTACWKCLESRLKHNHEVETYIQRKKGRQDPFPITRMQVPLFEFQALSIAVMQLVRWLATGTNPVLESKIISIDVMNAQQNAHWVLRRPQCEACGNPKLAQVGGRPVVIRSQTLTAHSGGNGLRTEAPEVTYERYVHHVSEYSGIIKGIYPSAWHGKGPLKVYMAGHNFALKNDQLYFIKDGLRSSSSGKGRTDIQARTSALCEALERYSGLFRGEEERHKASFQELGDDAVDPRTVSMFSDQQYREREAWLARNSRFQVVPLPFDETAEISWSPIWSWTEQRLKYLPTCQLYYGFEDSPETFFFWGDSNGNAAGSSFEDAILQGFLELVERDSVALWWYTRVSHPQVDIDSLKDPYIDRLCAFYAEHGRRFWVLDLTADLGIPAFAAINQRLNAPTEDIVFGFGAHLDARIGISRALTEMNQFMPAVLTVNDQDQTQYAFGDPDVLNWWQTARAEEHPYLLPANVPARRIEDMPATTDKDVKAQLEDCFARVEKQGHEVLILDQTRPDVGLPVAKVIVPGLRHFWARYAPGRLYDVPVRLGWLDKPLSEDELNPIAMFI